MSIWRLVGFLFAGLALAGVFTFAVAQDQEELEERSALVEFVERIISTPDRQIRLGQITGALSSNVRFSEITIADREGVWLRIENVRLVWSRTALVFGRLEIDELEADEIVMERRPHPPEDAIPEEAQLSIPELPVATNIGRIAVPRVAFGDDVFGLSSELSLEGRLRLADGDLDTHLQIRRLDGPGGALDLLAVFDSGAETLELDVELSEPADGVVANLLNLQGRPALTFTVAGSGPIHDYSADIRLIADGEELLAGTTEIARVANGFRLVADVAGRLGELAPPAYGDLFGDRSTLAIDAIRADDGAVSVSRADLVSGRMSLLASAELAPDLFPVSFAFDAQLGTDTVEPVTLPFGDGIVVGGAHIVAEVGEEDPDRWSAEFDLRELVTGTLTAERATITAGGLARNRAVPAEREVTFEVSGTVAGLGSGAEDIAQALGESLELAASGEWAAGEPIVIEAAQVATDHVAAHFAGQIFEALIEGEFRAEVEDLSPFSGVAARPLEGQLALSASGSVGLGLERFDLVIDGTADGLALQIEPFDNVFGETTTLTGAIARGEEGLRFDDLTLGNPNAQARINGVFGAEEVDLAVTAELPDVSVLNEQAGGAARLEARLSGVGEIPAVEVTLTGEALTLLDRPFTDATAQFVGTLDGSDIAGRFALSGNLDGVVIDGSTEIATVDGLYTLEDIAFGAGATALTGDLTVRPDGLLSGALQLESPDLSVIAPLALTELMGSISASVTLDVVDDRQDGHLIAAIRGLQAGGFAIGSADIDVRGENLRQAPILAGELEAAGIVAGPIEIDALSATAERVGDRTEFAATAELTEGVVTATGRLVPDNGGLDIEFDTFELREAAINAILAEPVVISLREDRVIIPSSRLNVGGGSVVIAGQVGERIDLQATIDSLDLAVANAFAPGLGLAGTVSGTLAATGPADAPRGRFELRAIGLTTAQLREIGVSAFTVDARGDVRDGVVDLQAALSGAGISLEARGAVPLAGPGLNVALTGTMPLSLADLVLAERGASLSGTLSVDARVTGSIGDPGFTGTLSADGARFVDVDIGLQLTNITLRARLSADQVVVESLTATSGGGTISAAGTIGIGNGFPADLRATLSSFGFRDGRLLTATLNGNLTVTGPLIGQPVLGGAITIDRAEIAVPDRLPTDAAMLDVVHVAPPQAVLDTLHRARLDEPRDRDARTGLVLDLTIDAPARVFVRGRGIDAEFGGRMTLRGPVDEIRPVGSFTMRRGRIVILGQRITFTSGSITLIGNLDPMLNFVATTRARNITVTANVTGRASDPDIVLSSVPELPQDEVLAQFLFGRSLNDLSPLQIAQLATAAAGLVGGQDGGGLLGGLRGATGLDDLDLVTGEDGGVAVRAGRYVADNVYLGVQADQHGDAGVSINLDITEGLTARGEVDTEGQSRVGIFYEREY